MYASGRNDPVIAPKGADQNTPLDGHWWRSARPTIPLIQQCPRPQRHLQSEIVVVVLGVMYRRVLPQPVEANTHPDLVVLTKDVDDARRGLMT